MKPRKFFAELKRRHLYRVAIAYGVVAWLFVQIATQVFPFFEIPNFVVRVVVLITILGFPVALVIAWAFEMTPEGLRRDHDITPNEYIPRWSTRKFAALVTCIAIFAAGAPLVHLLRHKPAFLSRVSATSALSEKSTRRKPQQQNDRDCLTNHFCITTIPALTRDAKFRHMGFA
jgi:hypothetical protein